MKGAGKKGKKRKKREEEEKEEEVEGESLSISPVFIFTGLEILPTRLLLEGEMEEKRNRKLIEKKNKGVGGKEMGRRAEERNNNKRKG